MRGARITAPTRASRRRCGRGGRAFLRAGVPLVWTVALLWAAPGGAQEGAQRAASRSVSATDAAAAEAPFGPGERLEYQVKLGLMNVGEGYLSVQRIDTVRGFPTYHLDMRIDASTAFGLAHMNDRYQSWLDTRTLVSRRFVRDIDETGYKGRRVFEIYPEEKRWERLDDDKTGSTPSILPLDEISFLYYVRTLPLEVGEEYRLHRYFKTDGNPVVVKVLRREQVTVPAGTFDAIVVQPIIRTSGLFGEGGEAELYLTDDGHRHLVFLRSRVPVVGSLSLLLTDLATGVPLNPEARARESRASG